MIVDSLASRLGITLANERGGYSGSGIVQIGETQVSLTLYKSSMSSEILYVCFSIHTCLIRLQESFMNISGPSIVAACRKTVSIPSSMIVISDSLSHRVETLSARLGGSPNGHNGVKSVISALGNDPNFYRFRVGIGRNEGTDAADYVLQRLSNHEVQFWTADGIDLVLKEIEKIAHKVES